ncbi:amino acid adenylation domain-containing protein [Streptomyces inhibens]|uniref:Amino acid adenylation domain-containing protein n=1 Tax=Streptomyces inhibens TaxID=2293571 RepID=A0A371PPN7_STRIH|nr:non-ribosomal peptide synthetase [Streptomyces inhibens]REK84492.1 amino acid adenylation domain-containing protein [Streptomyces inhibens]
MASLKQYEAPAISPAAPRPPGHGEPLPAGPLSPVHELVRRFARGTPARTAVRSGTDSIGYGELDAWAERIAARLIAEGVGHGARVGVLAEPSTAMIAAVLGILRCGAAYVPVAPSHPDRRITGILADAQVSAVVVTGTGGKRLACTGVPVIRADSPGDEAGSAPGPPAAAVSESDPAYLIYTSGSTGEPKGVVVDHGRLAASTAARRMVYPGEPVFLLVSLLAFDSSVAGLWGTLTAGGCLIVASADEVRDPERLVELVERHEVTHLLCVPSLYSVLLDAARRLGSDRLRSLDTVIVAGEPLPPELVTRHFAQRTGPTALVNEYGPTEATVWASYHRFDAPGPVSIGRAVPGARLYVLDDALCPVSPGCEGELYIGGAGVTRGYHGRPEATAKAFLRDPFAESPEARMYRTGDLVRQEPDGTLVFLGRRDHQVKIRGHRVELGAVEAQLCELPGVREAAVVVHGTGSALVGFVLAPAPVDAASLREQLAARLPAAMVPARIVVLDRFPRTVNGKTDRAALRERADAQPSSAVPVGPAQPAASDLTAQVSAAWAEVLKTAHVPVDVNFFDVGGHSLAIYQLREALERHTGQRPPVVALFQHTTVAAQAAMLRDGAGQAADNGQDTRARQAAARRARALRAGRRAADQQEAS